MPKTVCIFYVQYLPATEVGTTSTATRSISIDSTKAGVSGTGVVLDDYTILQYIQQQLNWSLIVYMHWEWCLQGYLVYYYCIYSIQHYTYQYIFTYEPRYKVALGRLFSLVMQAQAMPKTVSIFYVQYLSATELGTTSTVPQVFPQTAPRQA
uniref:Uncharacterized protein n=1 Tax=Spironucleus salmonicida TaxID=348837 RepID=V6LRJ7_9EUKA|eukprot:EST47282.1 Hypothetical protein SS50377_12792 [Spironucleus salmonicida]